MKSKAIISANHYPLFKSRTYSKLKNGQYHKIKTPVGLYAELEFLNHFILDQWLAVKSSTNDD